MMKIRENSQIKSNFNKLIISSIQYHQNQKKSQNRKETTIEKKSKHLNIKTSISGQMISFLKPKKL